MGVNKMIKQLIVNADDFALTSGVSRAIIEAHQKGIVTSTTILGNCDEKLLEDAQCYAESNPKLGFGAHLVLTTRRPILSTHKTLIDEQGNFKYTMQTINESLDVEEVYEEWKAQIERLLNHFKLTHLDSHHHVHLLPYLKPIVLRLSEEYNLPIRDESDGFPRRVKVDIGFYGENATLDYLKGIMDKNTGILEIMVHPGYKNDLFLSEISSYSDKREEELEILTSESIQTFIRDNNIELVNYGIIHLNKGT